MKKFPFHRQRPYWLASILVPVLLFVLACGPGEQPTPTPLATATSVPAATPTSAPLATATLTSPGPVATPTPTSVAAPIPTPTPGEQPKRGGTLNLVEGATPAHFDAYLGYSPGFQAFLGKQYSNLFINYVGEKVDCEICSEAGWRLEDGGKTMVFNIKPGIKFNTGKELTSADVAYSINMMMGNIDGIVSARVGWVKEYISSIETPGAYELRIKLVRPSAVVPKLLSTSFAIIVPQGTTRDDFKSGVTPKGSGPFILKQFIADASLTLERNPNYFKPGLPYLDKVVWTIAADTNTQWAAFYTHKQEYKFQMEEPVDQYLAQLFKLRDDGKIKYISIPGVAGYFGVWMVGSKPPFNDLRVRQAVNLGVDRVAFGQGTFGDRAVPQLLMFLSGEDYGTPADKIWNVVPGWGTGAKKQQELEQAKKLLADAGFPNGMDIAQFSSTATNVGYAAGSQLLQSQLKQVGIRTTLDIAKTGGTDFANRLAALDYLIQNYIFYRITGDPDEALGQYMITGASRNATGYSNKAVDKLYTLMSSETDPVKRKQLFFQAQDIILNDLWYAPAQNHNGYITFWPNLGGIDQIGLSPAFGSGTARGDRLWFK